MLLIDKMITVYPLHKNGKLCMYVCMCLRTICTILCNAHGLEASNAINILLLLNLLNKCGVIESKLPHGEITHDICRTEFI